MIFDIHIDDYQLPGPSSSTPMMPSGSQFCFDVVIVDDSVHEGSTPEQVTLGPISASTPDLLASPFPSVTVLIEDNDSKGFMIVV